MFPRRRFDSKSRLLAAQDAGKSVDVFLVRDEAEAKKKMKRRHKRQREKARQRETKAGAGAAGEGEGEEDGERNEGLAASDELEHVACLTAGHKIRSFAFLPEASPDKARLLLGLGNNCLEVHSVDLKTKETTKVYTLDGPGHRYDIWLHVSVGRGRSC